MLNLSFKYQISNFNNTKKKKKQKREKPTKTKRKKPKSTNVWQTGTSSFTWLCDHSPVISLLEDLGFIISTASIRRKSSCFNMKLGSVAICPVSRSVFITLLCSQISENMVGVQALFLKKSTWEVLLTLSWALQFPWRTSTDPSRNPRCQIKNLFSRAFVLWQIS